ncbi:hypothetical protein Tco_0893338 [Tanacetum coccineum]|uniref:Uncharacterized protein n=1 Tax=Tanacetum coccineum TaxID=301880 RepID=A0ABQ5CBR0_9ASTR
MLKIDVEPITPKLLNKRTAHSAYIKHTQEEAAVLRDLVDHVKANYPLDHSLESACRYTKLIQELLTNISNTCPSINNSSEQLVAVTPKIRVKPSTSASGSQPSGNTKKDKIQQTPSSTQKNKVKAPRKVKSSLKNKDCVVAPMVGTANVAFQWKPRKSKTNDPVSKSKVLKYVSANKKEPSQSWGSIVFDLQSFSLDDAFVQIVLGILTQGAQA